MYLNKMFREWTYELDKSSDEPLSEQLRTMILHFEKIVYFMNC